MQCFSHFSFMILFQKSCKPFDIKLHVGQNCSFGRLFLSWAFIERRLFASILQFLIYKAKAKDEIKYCSFPTNTCVLDVNVPPYQKLCATCIFISKGLWASKLLQLKIKSFQSNNPFMRKSLESFQK